MTKIALAQLNFTVGDIDGNTQKIIHASKEAKQNNADLIAFPELALSGYPLEDLLLRQDIFEQIDHAIDVILQNVKDIDLLLTYPEKDGIENYNTAAWIRNGKIITKYHKQKLPNYGVFDEVRYFKPDKEPAVVELNGLKIGILICEDIWYPEPAEIAKKAGANALLCVNASPYSIDKQDKRIITLKQRVDETNLPILFCNLVGGQDELVFDGQSFMMNHLQEIISVAPSFEETILYLIYDDTTGLWYSPIKPIKEEKIAQIYKALTLGIRDYVTKNHFPGVVIGLSGGIDSALTLALAVDALGADAVEAVFMPSQYSAELSATEAENQAMALGVEFHILPIQSLFDHFQDELTPIFSGYKRDVTEENMQARIRGIFLMAISNKTGKMVLSTGNKSEVAVGYSTLYGDMVGGFDALKDISKTLVYELAVYRNNLSPSIPQAVIDRPPSAELAPNQFDQDSLPPYPDLDAILEYFIERDCSYDEIVEKGYDPDVTRKVLTLVLKNEYKRRQAPPGVRITERAFGRDRRYPITSGYEP